MMGNGVIALGDSLASVSWYFRVNLGTKDHYSLVCLSEDVLFLYLPYVLRYK